MKKGEWKITLSVSTKPLYTVAEAGIWAISYLSKQMKQYHFLLEISRQNLQTLVIVEPVL
jgi:hypothetical protein